MHSDILSVNKENNLKNFEGQCHQVFSKFPQDVDKSVFGSVPRVHIY